MSAEGQIYFPFCGEVRCSPEVLDHLEKSFDGIRQRLNDVTELILDCERKVNERIDGITAKIHALEKQLGAQTTKN